MENKKQTYYVLKIICTVEMHIPMKKKNTLRHKKAGAKYQIRYFGNPAVYMRPLRLSAPSSRMV